MDACTLKAMWRTDEMPPVLFTHILSFHFFFRHVRYIAFPLRIHEMFSFYISYSVNKLPYVRWNFMKFSNHTKFACSTIFAFLWFLVSILVSNCIVRRSTEYYKHIQYNWIVKYCSAQRLKAVRSKMIIIISIVALKLSMTTIFMVYFLLFLFFQSSNRAPQ